MIRDTQRIPYSHLPIHSIKSQFHCTNYSCHPTLRCTYIKQGNTPRKLSPISTTPASTASLELNINQSCPPNPMPLASSAKSSKEKSLRSSSSRLSSPTLSWTFNQQQRPTVSLSPSTMGPSCTISQTSTSLTFCPL